MVLQALEKAGCFAIVLECVPGPIAAAVTAALSIPTIGIGAGPATSGQVRILDMTHIHRQKMQGWLRACSFFCRQEAGLGLLQSTLGRLQAVWDPKCPRVVSVRCWRSVVCVVVCLQVLVYHDLLGMMSHPHHAKVTPKFCKQYAHVGRVIQVRLCLGVHSISRL